MSLLGIVESFANGTYTVTRRARGAYGGDGLLDAGATSTLQVSAAVFPTSQRQRLTLPEGVRTRESRAVYTAAPLKILDASFDADLVAIDGDSWEVVSVGDWISGGGVVEHLVAKVPA